MLYNQLLNTSTTYSDSPQSSVRLIQDYTKSDKIYLQSSDIFNALCVLNIINTTLANINLSPEQIEKLNEILANIDNLVTQDQLKAVIATIPDAGLLATKLELLEVKNSIPSIVDFITNTMLTERLTSTTITIQNWANSRFALNSDISIINTQIANHTADISANKTAITLLNNKLVGISTTIVDYVGEVITEAINNLDVTLFLPVKELPIEGRTNKIYLVPIIEDTENNKWLEWIWVQKPGTTTYAWETIGSINLDIDPTEIKTWVSRNFVDLTTEQSIYGFKMFNDQVEFTGGVGFYGSGKVAGLMGDVLIKNNKSIMSYGLDGKDYNLLKSDNTNSTILGNTISKTLIASNTHIYHINGTSDYVVWDASNLNLPTIDFVAKELTVAGNLSAAGITLTGGAVISGSVLIAGDLKVATSLIVNDMNILVEIDALKASTGLTGTGIKPGIYTKVTVDTYGRVIDGDILSILDMPNLSDTYVTITGNQTISGIKTFTESLYSNGVTYLYGSNVIVNRTGEVNIRFDSSNKTKGYVGYLAGKGMYLYNNIANKYLTFDDTGTVVTPGGLITTGALSVIGAVTLSATLTVAEKAIFSKAVDILGILRCTNISADNISIDGVLNVTGGTIYIEGVEVATKTYVDNLIAQINTN